MEHYTCYTINKQIKLYRLNPKFLNLLEISTIIKHFIYLNVAMKLIKSIVVVSTKLSNIFYKI